MKRAETLELDLCLGGVKGAGLLSDCIQSVRAFKLLSHPTHLNTIIICIGENE